MKALRNQLGRWGMNAMPIFSENVNGDSEINSAGNIFSIVVSLTCDFRMATTRGRRRSFKAYGIPSQVISHAFRFFSFGVRMDRSNENKISDAYPE